MDYANKGVLTEKEACALFGISPSFLQKRRVTGDGPIFYKVGSRVYYKKEDIEQFLVGKPHRSTAEYETTYKKRARAQA